MFKICIERILGMTQACVSDYLSFSIIIINISILHRKDDAKIHWPSVKKIHQYKNAVVECHSLTAYHFRVEQIILK